MASEYILALDLGTTGNRAIVFDRDQNRISQFYEEFPQIYPKPGWVEHDAEHIWSSTERVLRKTFRKISPKQIRAIGLTNQRETVLLWSADTGRPLGHAIVWQCRRTAAFCEGLKKRGLSGEIHRHTGLFPDAYFSASKIRWLLENVKGARRLAEKGSLRAGTIDSWIAWKLSGGRAHVTDVSNASRTLLFNIHTLRWDDELLKLFSIPKGILPEIVPSSGIAAETDPKLFGREIPIAGIAGDQQAAAFAQGCTAPGIIKNTYGTGLFLLENIGSRPRLTHHLLTTVAWALGSLDRAEYAFEGSVFIAGAAIQWLRDGLRLFKSASESEKLACSLPSNEGVYFVPAFVGLGTPYWDPSARGTILGLTRGSSGAHLARAALEAMAYQTRDLVEIMSRASGKPFKVLKVDGGAAANDFLLQFQADLLGIPIVRPKILETTALGAAGLAGIAAGMWSASGEFQRRLKSDRIFKPKLSRRNADALYKGWGRAVSRARGWAV